ncbi:AcrR family transcriptional regulator [Paenibacillus shirakamiensis]|uniref:AcrR family transcriptional regulator n=1 Tax=Paenibacillus shirakamiensis TaxID=1265935 RepID=A0ABS4JEV8_9BACL|nr:TetR/AcrR family transcriptional regulator [Paenibacillus shirakamiensis]MBP2000242.1 AcrR family transcriptional regulator [Paenibacillus shirakamiensis]
MSEQEKKKDRRIARSTQALKKALLDLMAKKSFKTISITEIVELADYNRGTFYTHYESKEALLDDIISELIQDLLRSFRAPYEKIDVFRVHELPANSVMIFDHVYQHALVYKIILKSDVLSNVREKMFIALKDISMHDLEYPDHDINQELLATYSIHALLGLVFYWIESDFHHSPLYMQEQLMKIVKWRPTTATTVKK